MLPPVSLNWTAILISAIVSMIIGFFWYSPSFFGKAWMRSLWTMDEIKKHMDRGMRADRMAMMYGKTFAGTLIMAFVLSLLIHMFGISSASDAAALALLIWLGFIATQKISDVTFEGKNFNYYIITVMYYFVSLLVMSWILVTWL